MNLRHLILQEWLTRPGRALLTILSVSIAVATLLGVLLAASSSRKAYQQMSAQVEGPPSLEILPAAGGRFLRSSVPSLTSYGNIQQTLPLLFRGSIVRWEENRVKVLLMGTDLPQLTQLPTWKLSAGRLCEAEGEVLLDEDFARDNKIELDQELRYLAGSGTSVKRVRVTVVGLYQGQAINFLSQGAVLLCPIETLQDKFNVPDQVDRVRLVLDKAEFRPLLLKTLSTKMPEELVLQSPSGRARLAEEMLSSGELALNFATALSLGMAVLIILNTMRMNFAERRKQFAIMRCLGATHEQISRLLLWEGALIGVIGTLLGIPAGYGIAVVINQGTQQLLETTTPAVSLTLEALLAAAIAGPLVALVAAYFPARQAQRITPLEGLQDVETTSIDAYPWKSLAACLAIWLFSGTVVWGVSQGHLSPQISLISGVLTMVSFVLGIPLCFAPIVRAIAWCFPRGLQFSAQLATEQLLRRRTRTALTAGVMVVAVANSVGMGNAIQNNIADVRLWISQSLADDFFLWEPAGGGVNSTASWSEEHDPILAQLKQVPGVAEVGFVSDRQVQAGGEPAYCRFRRFVAHHDLPLQLCGPDAPAEVRQRLLAGEAVVGSTLAKRAGVKVGDSLRLELAGRTQLLQVGGINSDYDHGGMTLQLDWDAAGTKFEIGGPQCYTILNQPGIGKTNSPALQEVSRQHGLLFFSVVDLRNMADKTAQAVVGSLWALLAIGFIVGGFGIGNTLMMSVMEQTRELGLLRIIGMTPGQIWRLVLSEAVLIGAVGLVLGTLGGLYLAWSIHLVNEPLLGHSVRFTIHLPLLVTNLVAAMLVVIIAAWSPGWRASRLNLLQAIGTE